MNIGEKVKKIRLAKGLTQFELARKVNVSRPLITQIERGTRIPSILLSQDIAKALNCTIEDLIREVKNKWMSYQ